MDYIFGTLLFVAWVVSIGLVYLIYARIGRMDRELRELRKRLEVNISICGHLVSPEALSGEFRQRLQNIVRHAGETDAVTALQEDLGVDPSKAVAILGELRKAG